MKLKQILMLGWYDGITSAIVKDDQGDLIRFDERSRTWVEAGGDVSTYEVHWMAVNPKLIALWNDLFRETDCVHATEKHQQLIEGTEACPVLRAELLSGPAISLGANNLS